MKKNTHFPEKSGKLNSIPVSPPADSTFAQILSWHIANGTRPDSLGEPWSVSELADAIEQAEPDRTEHGTSERNVRNWLSGKRPHRWTTLSKVFFGSNSTFEPRAGWRMQFYDAWRQNRPNVRHLSGKPDKSPLADRFLWRDKAEKLIEFYRGEDALNIQLGDDCYELPFVYVIEPRYTGEIAKQSIEFRLSTDAEYEPPVAYDHYITPIVKIAEEPERQHHNGIVLRLKEIVHEDDKQILVLQKARYFISLATNFAMDHKPATANRTLRQQIHGSTRTLKDNVLVNHIGLVCMVETADGYLVVQRRAAKGLANRGDTLSSSISGSLKFDYDIKNVVDDNKIPLSIIAKGVVRESMEELGIDTDRLYFLGLLKEMLRGGKPEIYFFARSALLFGQIEESHRTRARTKAESHGLKGIKFVSKSQSGTNPIDFYKALEKRAKMILDEVSNDANMTLVAGILLVVRHIKSEISFDNNNL